MEPKEYSAFTALPNENGADQPHHIIVHGAVTTDAGESALLLTIPVSSLEQARKGTSTERGAIGFRLTADFALGGKPYELHARWVALRRPKR